MSVAVTGGHPQYSTQGLIPEFFANDFNIAYWRETLLPRITTGRFYEQVLEQGHKVTVAAEPTMVTRAYTKGQTLAVDLPSSTPITLTVDRARYFNFLVDKVDMKQSHLDIGPKYVDVALKQMAQDIEDEFFASIRTQAHAKNQGATAGVKSSSFNLGAAGTPLALTDSVATNFITMLRACLGEQNAAFAKKMWVIVPEWARYLLVNSELKNAMIMGDPKSVMRTGQLGKIDEMTIYTSNGLPVTTADKSTGTYILAGNMDAISYISQMSETDKLTSETTFGTKFRALQVYDWNVRKPEGLVVAYVYKG
jgi:hypothetical protein